MDHKKLDFPHQLGKPDYPACLPHKRALSLDYLTPHRFTTSQPRAPGRRFAPAQVLFVEVMINQCRGDEDAPSPEGLGAKEL